MVANHTNWWDGFMAVLVTRALGRRFQVLMEARHLARYRAFLRVGALPLRRGHPAAAREDLARALPYMDPAALLWVFPQGSRRPATEPVGRLESGAAWLALAKGTPVRIQPMAFRYAYRGEQLPEAFAWAGKGWTVEAGNRRDVTHDIELSLRQALDLLDDRLRSEHLADARLLVPGRLSVNKRLDQARHAVGLLDGPFEARNG